MKLLERLSKIHNLFVALENTSSRNEKENLIDYYRGFDKQLSEDLDWCFEYLSGQHKLGYKVNVYDNTTIEYDGEDSLKEFLKPFYQLSDHSDYNISKINKQFDGYGWFLNPLLNREWRLGVNRSQLDKTEISPMLAKKFEIDMKCVNSKEGYYITQKLDGNRCIAKYDYENMEWKFYSRSGKQLRVKFNTCYLDPLYIYDGEVLSKDQVLNPSQQNFNTLSGELNNKSISINLMYYVFDIIIDKPYYVRRTALNGHKDSDNVKILPMLAFYDTWENLCENIINDLDNITSKGGEGVMINIGDALYEHKRTDKLLKLKKVQSMDMKVIDLIPGTGKNEGLVGSLECVAKEEDTVFSCLVGSGLSDQQRIDWSYNPKKILGKIIEVQYFSLSQDKTKVGTNYYCLRFPRFKKVREDKDSTSVY